MSEGEMFEASFKRPPNYWKLTGKSQWMIDERLGILDWNGGCTHNKLCTVCELCKDRFLNHYKHK